MDEGSVAALAAVVDALGRAHSAEEVSSSALEAVRQAFGWAYGSYWSIAAPGQPLRFVTESGTVGHEFRQVTAAAEFPRGVGLSGRAWQSRDLVFVPDLGDVTDCVRAPAARRAGVRSGVCLPIVVHGEVVGTMDFFTTVTLALSDERRAALRLVGTLISQALERMGEARQAQEEAVNAKAISTVLSALGSSLDEDEVLRAALHAVRGAFGWQYGSIWKIDPGTDTLRFAVDSGEVNSEFRRVTLAASFAKGVGVSGRAWSSGALVFEPDLAEVTDCVRAPAARRAGVKSGVCFPIKVAGETVATMDFFALRTLVLPAERLAALRNVGELVGGTVERLRNNRERTDVATQLTASVTQLSQTVTRSADLALSAVGMAQQVTARMEALHSSSEAISHIAQIIDGIADQTNLLALNATIEAARAGEAGRGFAVVATEVKHLAGETASATGDVSNRIASIQLDTAAVTSAVQQIEGTIVEMNQLQQEISAVMGEQSAIARQFVR